MRALIAGVILAVATTAAAGGGQVPATNRIEFRAGHPSDIVVGTTIGMLVSHDAGTTWRYMCPAAIHGGGAYAPDYAYTATGVIAATSFDGLAVMRDGCTFGPTPLLAKFTSQVELDGVGGMVVAVADPMVSAITTSGDNAITFPQTTPVGMANDWWDSLLVDSSGSRIYVSGYRLAGTMRTQLLFGSHDSGVTFAPLGLDFITTTPTSIIDLVAIDPMTPERLYARVSSEDGTGRYDFYRSEDAGASWGPIANLVDLEGPPSLLARSNGALILATHSHGMKGSTDHGNSWEQLACTLHVSCLAESPSGEVWACTKNYDEIENPGDGYAVMRSTDLATWTAVMQFHDILGPVACAPGTIQHDQCEQHWADLAPQLVATTTLPACVTRPADGAATAGADHPIGGDTPGPIHVDREGCCSADGGRGNAIAILVMLLAQARRRRNHKV